MESLRQYIDLYKGNREAFDTGAPAVDSLKAGALGALEAFLGAKAARTPYAESSDEALLAPDYGINVGRLSFPVDLTATFHCEVPNISTLLGVTVNDSFRPTETLLRQLPDGVTVCSLVKAAREYPELVGSRLNALAADSTPAAALNTLLLQDGVFVHVAAGVRPERPVQLVNIFNAGTSLLAARRLLVVAEEGAKVCLLVCDHTQNREVDYLSDEVIEVFAGRDASVELYSIEESSARTRRICRLFARQEQGSTLTVNSNTLSCGVTSNSYTVDVAGQHADTTLGGLVIADGTQIVDSTVRLNHKESDCRSRQLFKYALFEDARGAFGGKIVVSEGAVRTDASQTNRNLLASEGARMATAPQLEIYCDDVKCSHGATVGQLDPRALFYMQTRGIPEAEARLMLTQAFMTDVIDSISYDIVRDRLRQLVEKRLGGERASCASCGAGDKNCSR